MTLVQQLERRSRPVLMLAGLAFLTLVGIVDYLAGFELYFSVFYLLGVGLGTWFVGSKFGLIMSVLSVIIGIVGDLAAGKHFSNPLIPIWNAIILLGLYGIVVWLLARLRLVQVGLEEKVRERTVALTQEMAERERLEKEILEVSEQERRRIGHELHDSLCQHLTGTALAGQVLGEKLAAKAQPEAADAHKIVELVEDGIALARNLARGIYPVEMDAEGLMAAFQEFAASMTKVAKVPCVFECAAPVLVHDATAATHLYRIAQEAVLNAIRHGQPRRIGITLSHRNDHVTLIVEDDGVGLPENWPKREGLGTRIMAHRAAMIGASFSIEPNPTGGTLVECALSTPRNQILQTPDHEHTGQQE